MQQQPDKQLYFPLLDTTRFIAFIPVFLTHCFITSNPLIQNASWFNQLTHFLDVGLLGLDYFFVLSSFLITRLIIDEVQQFKSFSFKLFFVRRSLRIWPLYFLMVALGFMCQFAGFTEAQLPPLINFATFTLNFYIADHGFNFLFFLVFLWSISVEEQFYIFWGLVLQFSSKISVSVFNYCIPCIAFGLIAISLWYRALHSNDELNLYFNTLSVAANFGIGILLAYYSAYNSWFISFFNRMSLKSVLILCCILLLSVGCYTVVFVHPVAIIVERVYFSFLFALIIGVLCYSQLVIQLQKWFMPFDYLGKISLGLYFYHGVIITLLSKIIVKYSIADKAWQVMVLNPLIMLTLTILCASVSYNYFEKPILAFKNKFYHKTSATV